jgi:transcriptional regulator with XRE-family HTH domain
MIGMHLLPTKPLTEYLDQQYPELHVTGPYKEDKITTLADRAGISVRSFNRWFAGQEELWVNSADRVCNALGVHPSEIWEEW